MADLLSILSSNYVAVGGNVNLSGSRYVNVDPDVFNGSWTGRYNNGQSFTVSISDISGFRATAKYQSGSTVKYQSVLIKDNAFRIGDSKFTLQRPGVAQVKTVITDPVTNQTSVIVGSASKD